jgi:predicted Rossmann fold nucleotide-binding protein DprA/Smf involved in DNA uptake
MRARTHPELAPAETTILDLLGTTPKSIDDLITESGLTPGEVAGALLTLELKHVALQLPKFNFIRRN